MKQISENIADGQGYHVESIHKIYDTGKSSRLKYWFYGSLLLTVIILLLPWTQNIRSTGKVTTQYQEQRPQQINSIIPGRIIKWHVKEGDYVEKGDTIVELADTKDDYLDPQLLERTEDQLNAKEQKIEFYRNKISATESQLNAIENGRDLKIQSLQNKIEQTKRKLISDSAEWVAADIDFKISKQQYDRAQNMFKTGIISLVELEKRTAVFNKSLATSTEKQQKFQNTKQDLLIANIEMSSIQQDAADKIFKARGEIAAANSEVSSTQADVSKNMNQLSNYLIRGNQRWIIAPQNGQIVKAKKAGINEMVKEGDMVVEIIPNKIDHAVELFIEPMDLILLQLGQDVRLTFDGFPAVVFSGWPNSSYGTFPGVISTIETNVSENGKFRILVIPSRDEKKWPTELKMGAGVQGFALLKNVPVWYELWRQINGFPPDFYASSKQEKKGK
jgi:multidrug resistance efflux pump